MIGWGITKNIALALDASGAQISSVDGNYNLGHADIGARWHFVNRTAFVPFVDVGYAGRALMKRDVTLTDALGNTSTGTLTYMGAGLSYGGGLQYFVTPGIAFGRNAEGYLRFSYSASIERIREGLRRLGAFLAARR